MNSQAPDPPTDKKERAYTAYGAVTSFGTCPVCGREKPLEPDGVMVEHDHRITDHVGKYRQRCSGSGRYPELDPPQHATPGDTK